MKEKQEHSKLAKFLERKISTKKIEAYVKALEDETTTSGESDDYLKAKEQLQ